MEKTGSYGKDEQLWKRRAIMERRAVMEKTGIKHLKARFLMLKYAMARYECSFLYLHLTLTIIRYVETYSLRQSS